MWLKDNFPTDSMNLQFICFQYLMTRGCWWNATKVTFDSFCHLRSCEAVWEHWLVSLLLKNPEIILVLSVIELFLRASLTSVFPICLYNHMARVSSHVLVVLTYTDTDVLVKEEYMWHEFVVFIWYTFKLTSFCISDILFLKLVTCVY